MEAKALDRPKGPSSEELTMIKSIEFTNYRAFEHIKATFEPFTVVVGANASGKTSLLRGIEEVATGNENSSRQLNQLRHQGSKGEVKLSCTFYGSVGEPNGPFHRVGEFSFTKTPDLFGADKLDGDFPFLFPTVRYLSLQSAAISKPTDVTQGAQIQVDGGGLAAWLVDTAGRDRDRLAMLQDAVKRVVPGIDNVTYGVYPKGGVGMLFSFRGVEHLSADKMSEGTLFTVAVIAAVLDAKGPSILLFDDIEHGLHPRAQRELVAVIRAVQTSKPELQVIATTHSPYLLGELEPHEVRILSRAPNGETECKRLDEHPDFERWKNRFDPGELWSFFGEDWTEAVAEAEQPSA